MDLKGEQVVAQIELLKPKDQFVSFLFGINCEQWLFFFKKSKGRKIENGTILDRDIF